MLDAAGKRPDYTIMPKTSHTWCLEAKHWDVRLDDKDAVQALNYANQNGVRWVVLTNGKEWRLYDNHIHGVASDKRVRTAELYDADGIEEFLSAIRKESICDGRLDTFAKRARRLSQHLSKELLDGSSSVVKAVRNVVKKENGLKDVNPTDVAQYFRDLFSKIETPSLYVPPPSTPLVSAAPADGESFSLTELNALGNKLHNTKPMVVYMPGEIIVETKSWKDVAVQIVKYIISLKGSPRLPYKKKR